MINRVSKTVITLGVIGALAGCEGAYPSPLLTQGEPLERKLLQCKQELGLAGDLKTNVSQVDGQVVAVALPHDQIDAAAAQRINDCAGGASVLDDGMVVVPLEQAPAVAAPQAALPVTTSATVPARGPCPAGVTGLYRGTLFCGGQR